MSKPLLIKNGRIIDPLASKDKVADILIEGTKIKNVGYIDGTPAGAEIIDASGLVVSPGFVDLHTHLREPGREDEETLETVSLAALAGGFTSITAMPNTNPVTDNASAVTSLLKRSDELPVDLFVAGAMTKGLKGEEIAELAGMTKVGTVFFTDDGKCVQSAGLTRKVMEYARGLKKLVLLHCEDETLTQGSQMNESRFSTMFGLNGWPSVAESSVVARDIQLSALTGCSIHITHVSCKRSVELIREAKANGLSITCDVTPHHLALTEKELSGYDSNYKVNPPLRSEEDRLALIEGVVDGTVDAIATDHAPHAEHEKECEFDYAAFGMIGLETALPVCLSVLYHTRKVQLMDIIGKLTHQPLKILGFNSSGIKEGSRANLVIFDPEKNWMYTKNIIKSKSKNSPFIGKKMQGRVISTIYNGKKVYDEREQSG